MFEPYRAPAFLFLKANMNAFVQINYFLSIIVEMLKSISFIVYEKSLGQTNILKVLKMLISQKRK